MINLRRACLNGFVFSILSCLPLAGAEDIEGRLVKLALSPMPDYEQARDAFVREVSDNELKAFKPECVLARIMLPIILLHKYHNEHYELFNSLWCKDNDEMMKKFRMMRKQMKKTGMIIHYILGEKEMGNPHPDMARSHYRYIEVPIMYFIWPKEWSDKELGFKTIPPEVEHLPDGRILYGGGPGQWKIDHNPPKDLLLKRQEYAKWSRITVLEFLFKYVKSNMFINVLNAKHQIVQSLHF